MGGRIDSRIVAVAAVALVGGLGVSGAGADVFKVANISGRTRTLSDLYAYSQKDSGGIKTEVMKRGAAGDDVNIAAGGSKNIQVPNGSKSFTVSWKDANGKEVEADTNTSGWSIRLAMFSAPNFGGDIAVAFGDLPGSLPDEGFMGLVTNGKIDGGSYDWITFYDTSASDGFILRDSMGLPISPVLSGTSVLAEFQYEISVPAPAAGAVLAGVGLAGARRRRSLG